jgi:multiple sugar transport system ATP-binding protein
MAEIVLDKVTKRYPDGYEAVREMDLDVNDGEIMILVGPSGCGKSTALRMIAGLEDITEGELRIGDTVVNQIAPKDRDIAMVFQNYALYPHMTVRENMAFPLKLAKAPQEEIDSKVQEAAKILDLTQHLDRKPANLSGGQRQRVAMGRAIVRDPQAFLMDQTEAMTLGDRVAVMRTGVLQQVGSPGDLYNNPLNLFVAGFIGSPAMNFMPAKLRGDTAELPMAEVRLTGDARERAGGADDERTVIAGIRPESFEDVSMVSGDTRDRGTTFKTKIDLVESMGAEKYAYFQVEEAEVESEELRELEEDAGVAEVPGSGVGQVVARLEAASPVERGTDAELWLDSSKLHFFDPETGRSLAAG